MLENDAQARPDWKVLLDRHYERALRDEFPLFNGSSKNSTPFNAAPYFVSYDKFLFQAASWDGRGDLLHALQACLAEARELGVCIDGMLMGGSYLDLSNSAPNDVDCVWLYRADVGQGRDTDLLMSLQRKFKQRQVDVRFIPVDTDPLLFAKTFGFFMLFYAVGKLEEDQAIRAPLLIDCTLGP